MQDTKLSPIKNKDLIKISVRNLVEFVLRSGDIDDRIGGADSIRAMQEGTRIHKKLQAKGGRNYHPEVPLRTIVPYEDYDLLIEGRADGIIYEDGAALEEGDTASNELPISAEDNSISPASQVTVDEIKGTYRELDTISEPEPLHLAQAKCYAYMIAKDNELSSVDVRITYCNFDSEEVLRFLDNYSYSKLQDWFYEIVGLYQRWAEFSYYFRNTRNASIHTLDFPYTYRPGQRDLAKSVYRTIAEKKRLFIQAPTGTGKTLSTLFPAVKAVGEGLAEKIFYLTAKTITRTVAMDTISLFASMGYRAKTVIITAKDKLCFLEERACNPDECPYAKGHFDRINDAVYEALMDYDLFDADRIIAIAMERMICPFELNLDISSWSDNIICDYNYVFDPNVYLKRFFSEGIRSDGIFLIDEAHNLVDRGRNMYSETLVKEDFLAVKKDVKLYKTTILKGLNKCNKILLGYKKYLEGTDELPEGVIREGREYIKLTDIDELIFALGALSLSMDRYFEKLRKAKSTEDVSALREFYFTIKNFLNLTDGMGYGYEIYGEKNSDGEFCLHLFCVDPSRLLQERLDRGVAAVFFSATLLPIYYFKRLLCRDDNPYTMYADTVFDSSQSRILVGADVTSRYKSRGDEMYRRYARYIYEIIRGHSGNYIVFFPSYRFMEDVEGFFLEEAEGLEYTLIRQERGMKESEKNEFLEAFSVDASGTLIGFCVLGGAFSEGIDLTDDRLIGAVIVGAGLPQVCNERRILQEHFGEHGFEYAYQNPGMNKVLQAAGRVIRTVSDRGIIALLDERFLESRYRACFPKEWDTPVRVTVDTVAVEVYDFWEKKSSPEELPFRREYENNNLN